MATDDGAPGGDPAEEELVDGVPVQEVVALLSLPPDQFVAARTARARELRAGGLREVAAALSKLRKPTRWVWVVGEVARRDPDLAAEVVAAAEEAESAMSGAADLRLALEDLRTAVSRAASAGATVDRTSDRPTVELAIREILSDPAARRAWAGGWLLQMPAGPAAPPDELAPRRARREAERAAARRAGPDGTAAGTGAPSRSTAAERKARAAEAAAREAARRERERAVRAAEQAAAAATEGLARAVAEHDDATAALEEAEERLARLREEAEAARARLDAAATALEEAQAAASRAEDALASLVDDSPAD